MLSADCAALICITAHNTRFVQTCRALYKHYPVVRDMLRAHWRLLYGAERSYAHYGYLMPQYCETKAPFDTRAVCALDGALYVFPRASRNVYIYEDSSWDNYTVASADDDFRGVGRCKKTLAGSNRTIVVYSSNRHRLCFHVFDARSRSMGPRVSTPFPFGADLMHCVASDAAGVVFLSAARRLCFSNNTIATAPGLGAPVRAVAPPYVLAERALYNTAQDKLCSLAHDFSNIAVVDDAMLALCRNNDVHLHSRRTFEPLRVFHMPTFARLRLHALGDRVAVVWYREVVTWHFAAPPRRWEFDMRMCGNMWKSYPGGARRLVLENRVGGLALTFLGMRFWSKCDSLTAVARVSLRLNDDGAFVYFVPTRDIFFPHAESKC